MVVNCRIFCFKMIYTHIQTVTNIPLCFKEYINQTTQQLYQQTQFFQIP